MRQVYELLVQLDHKSSCSLVTIIIDYVREGGRICQNAHNSAAELLYTTCISPSSSSSHSQHVGPDIRQYSQSKETAVLRQRELLLGIQKFMTELTNDESLESGGWIRAESVHEFSVFLWSAACVIWHNFSDSSIRYNTVALCLEIGPAIIPKLAQFVLNSTNTLLKKASCWLLCSFGRTSSEHPNQIFECLGIADCTADEYSISVMQIIGKVCQSTAAAKYLIDKKLFSNWAMTSIEIAREEQHIRIDELTAIINCFSVSFRIAIVTCVI